MTNSLIAVVGGKPNYLLNQPNDTAQNQEFLAGVDSGLGLNIPTLSFRGKGWRLRKGNQEISLKRTELEVIFVRARTSVSKRFYSGQYSPDQAPTAPTCWSTDGQKPDCNDPVAESCTVCPNNVWGSATTGTRVSKGKACQDYKRMIVLPVGIAGFNEACVLDVPPSSFKKSKEDRNNPEMLFKEYVGEVSRSPYALSQLVTTIGFTDAEFPQLHFRAERVVTKEEWDTVQGLQTDEDVLDALGGAMEIPAQITKTSTIEVGKPVQQPIKVEQEPEEQPKKRTRKAKVEESAPEDSDEGTEADTPSDDDLIAEINSLLGNA